MVMNIKRLAIILIIIFFLLSFAEISYLNEESSKIKWGIIWDTSTNNEQVSYMLGMRNGRYMTTFDLIDRFKSLIEDLMLEQETWEKAEEIAKLWEKVVSSFLSEYDEYEKFLALNNDVVKEVMADLYKDPANMYINPCQICKIAYHKIQGEDIALLLQEARKEAFQNH